jgi:hypothetical protein
VLRPFHATTNYNKRYSRAKSPVQLILDRKTKDLNDGDSKAFWNDFLDHADPYVQMLTNVWYGSCFMATVPRLEFERFLPRIDFVVPSQTSAPNLWNTTWLRVLVASRTRYIALYGCRRSKKDNG